MRLESEQGEGRRPVGAGVVTSWVMAAMLIILSTFVAQFPDSESNESKAVAAAR